VKGEKKMQRCKDAKMQSLISSHVSLLTSHPFDPNEEIGGAILTYISTYAKGTPKIDYSA